MANGIYTKWLQVQNSKLFGWDPSTTVMGILEDSSSTYVFNPDHDTVDALFQNGFVELNADGYARPTVTGKQVVANNNNDEAQFRCDNVNFGAIEAGKTVKGVVLYVRTSTADDDTQNIPICYIDTATGLPLTTGGGSVVLAVPVTGIIKVFMHVPCTTPAP